MELTAARFAAMLGVATAHLPAADWRYSVIDGQERDKLVISLLGRLARDDFSHAASGAKRWETGWAENLAALRRGEPDALRPRYIRSGPLRLDGEFISPAAPDFEYNWYRAYRNWLFRTYLAGYDSIFEFGCGSGHNLPVLREMFPGAGIVGLDWAESSVEIAATVARGARFDFFHPDHTLDVPPNSAFLTMGAMEQTGTDWGPMLDFIIAKRPAFVLHSEPILELYRPDESLPDYLAARIHRQRNFWRGYLGELRQRPGVRIERLHRTGFGSLLLEGYSQLMWRVV